MKKASKIITAILCGLAVVGAGAYEVHSIITKEYERQARSAEETHRGIDLNLDMIKIAIQTTDEEVYDKNLAEAKEGVAKLGSLSMLAEEQEEFVTRANEYVEILESKKELLKETHELKEKIREIRGAFTEKYGNKDEISRDKVKAAKDEILGW